MTELRTAVNAMRAAAALGVFTFTDSSLIAIKAIHVTELRSALDAARLALSLQPASYTDSTITAQVTIVKAAHIQDVRNGVQ